MQINPRGWCGPKLYKISISQLCECETQMGSLFWAIAIQAFGQGHLSAWRVRNGRDHTRAHADLLIIYANFPPYKSTMHPITSLTDYEKNRIAGGHRAIFFPPSPANTEQEAEGEKSVACLPEQRGGGEKKMTPWQFRNCLSKCAKSINLIGFIVAPFV